MLKRPLRAMHARHVRPLPATICRSFVKARTCISLSCICPQGPELWGDYTGGRKSGVTLLLFLCLQLKKIQKLDRLMPTTLLTLSIGRPLFKYSGNGRADRRLQRLINLEKLFALPFLLRFLYVHGNWGHSLSEQRSKEALERNQWPCRKPLFPGRPEKIFS
jgi:hypothetical protein